MGLRLSARTKADYLGEEQLGMFGEKEDEEEKRAIKRRREYTDVKLD